MAVSERPDSMDVYEGGKRDGFYAGTCFGFLIGALTMGLLVILS